MSGMKQEDPSGVVRPKQRIRLSLKWFLILAAAIPAFSGLYIKRVIDRRSTLSELAAIASQHTRNIEYDFEFDEEGKPIPNATSPVPWPLLSLLGPSFFHDVVGVSLNGAHVAVEDLKTLGSLPNLKRLDVEYNSVSTEFLKTIGNLAGLERLDLQETGIRDDDLANIASLPNLRILLLSGRGISDEGLVHLRGMRKLQHVALRECSVTGSGLVHLAQSASLQSLDLRNCPIVDASRDIICSFKHLRELDLSDTAISNETVVFIGKALPKCTIVQE